jgi:membrane-associated protein
VAELGSTSAVLDAPHLFAEFGVAGIGVILFCETGLLIGLVLPGETLTVLAGAYSNVSGPSGSHPSFPLVIVAAGCGAILGGQMGYLIGRRAGPALFARPDGLVFRRSRLERTREYFARFGSRAVIIGRFVPFVRTLVSPAAGVGEMPARSFVPLNLVGGVVWATVVATIGYVVGGIVPIDRYAILVTAGIAAVSLVPLVLEIRAMRRIETPQSEIT